MGAVDGSEKRSVSLTNTCSSDAGSIVSHPMSVSGPFDPLRERPFLLLFLGQALARLGSSLVPVALAFAAYQVSGSAVGVGLVLMASRLPQVAFALVGGVLA